MHSTEYQAGAPVSGTVYLNMSILGALEEVSVEISGRERTTVITKETEWVPEDAKNPNSPKKTIEKETPHHDDRTLFKMKLPLWHFNGSLVRGQFTFPFAMTLPERIPGSTELRMKGGIAEISYSVTARVGARMGHLHSAQLFQVFERPMTAPRSLKAFETQKVYSCCCFPSGHMDFECLLANDTLRVGDVASVAAAVRNESSKPLKGFQVPTHRTRANFRQRSSSH